MISSDPLRQAYAAFARGDAAGALRLGEAALRSRPSDPAALQLVGIAHCQSGNVAKGLPYLRKAFARGARDAVSRFNLANALLNARELAEAEAVCTGGPQTPELKRLHADVLKLQGRHGEAIEIYEAVLASGPADPDTWNNLGNAKLANGDLPGALVDFQEALRLNPDNTVVQINIARTLDAAGSHDEALACFQEAARLAPRNATAQLEYGKALQRVGRGSEALVPLGTAVRINPADADAMITLGLTFAGLAQPVQAERAYRFALQADPRNERAFLNLAILLEQANRLDDLDALCARGDANGVPADERNYAKALLLRRRGKLEEALALANSAHPASLDASIKALFVGQVADQLGDADTAFAAFAEMNRITGSQPEAMRFDGSEHRLYVEGLAAATTAKLVRSWPPAPADTAHRPPAFLMGFLRSGTTLLDTILMGHDDTLVLEEEPILARIEESAGDVSRLGQLSAAQLGALRLSYFEAAAAAAEPPAGRLIIDKNPLASLRAPLIHRLFPNARFIFALRHPCDVVLSCFMQNFQINQAMASFLDLRDAALLYDRVMAYWQQCRDLLPLDVHTVRYEDLVEDVEGEVRPLLDHLGLAWDPRVLDHQRSAAERGYIRTPSYAQVTERIYGRASGRWVRYRHHLEHILPILAPWAERFGYSID